jgi:hypothetical protein
VCGEEKSLGSECVEFRLVYDGRLRAESRKHSRVDDKHLIRKVFHKQLVELWAQNKLLNHWFGLSGVRESLANDFQRGNGFRFVPLINNKIGGAYAMLDILFLRRDDPGNLVNAGDLDNRIKVLFDALKVPKTLGEIGSDVPDADEDPFHCLLEDDSLITSLKVTTDRLLWPLESQATLENHLLSDVFLVVHVKTGVFNPHATYAEIFW